MSACLKRFSMPVSCWRRVHKSQQLIGQLIKRYKDIGRTLNWTTDQWKPLDEIYIYTKQDLRENDYYLQLFGETASVQLEETTKDKKIDTDPERFTMGCSFKGLLYENDALRVIKTVDKTKMNVYSPRAGISSKLVENTLEQVIFEPLKKICLHFDGLRSKLTIQQTADLSKSRDRLQEGIAGENTDNLIESINSVTEDTVALFNRSNLKKEWHPHVEGYKVKKIDDQVSSGLFDLSDSIHGCGYRFSTLHIDVDDILDKDEQRCLDNRIRQYMLENEIPHFEINYAVSDIKYTTVAERMVSGNKEATLGCFATMDNGNESQLCAIVAKHSVTTPTVDNKAGEQIGTAVASTIRQDGYDIAAIKLDKQSCRSEFRREAGEFRPGILNNKYDVERLQNLEVYMWRMRNNALTQGKGKIASSYYKKRYFNNLPHIVVIDSTPSGKMAVKGDSGTIICVDDLDEDKVLLISMLIGAAVIGNDAATSLGRDTHYVTLPLKEGLDQLSKVSECQFKLYSRE